VGAGANVQPGGQASTVKKKKKQKRKKKKSEKPPTVETRTFTVGVAPGIGRGTFGKVVKEREKDTNNSALPGQANQGKKIEEMRVH